MKIGISVEDFGHEGFLKGLRERWCPEAQMIKGRTRGRSGISVRRDTPKVCQELRANDADIVVLLTDADDKNWREVLARQKESIPSQFSHCVICGVAARNVECWLVLDQSHATNTIGLAESDLDVEDPKPVVHRALGITGRDRKREEKVEKIAEIVRTMPLRSALTRGDDSARSLKALYEDVRDCAQQHGCSVPDELQAS